MKFLDYIRGLRTGKEARLIEHKAMSDPFLADAIDGYDSMTGNHADRIARMQARVSARTVPGKGRSGAWKIAVAAVVLIAFLGGYFALMNHESTMLVAHEQDNSYINLYAPEAYIEQKSLELTEIRESGMPGKGKLTAVVDIANLDEVIKPVDRIKIYIPETYAQLKKEDIELLSLAKGQFRDTEVKERNVKKPEVQVSEMMIAEARAEVPPASISSEWMVNDNRREKDSQMLNNYRDYEIPDSISVGINNKQSQVQNLAQAQPTVTRSVTRPAVPESFSGKLLTGKVVDEYDEPIPGAMVMLKGTNKGVITDIDGQYKLQVDASDKANLIANYLGYETVEVPNARDNQVIAMKEDKQQLDEVVVTGYGSAKKANITGSVAGVQTDRLAKKAIIPQPVTGENEYKKYLDNNVTKPIDPDCENKKGKVILEFNIDSAGRPVNIIVRKSLCDAFDKEAIRLVQNGPDWTYGSGKVNVEVNFK